MPLMNIRLPEEFSALQPETEAGGDWSVYLVLCQNGSLYCGVSNRPAERFAAHLAGRGARYTRMYKPREMRLAADGLDRAQAQRLEAGIKKLPKTRKTTLWRQSVPLCRAEEGGG